MTADAPPHVVSGVHLLVGVNSDEQCVEHKNIPIMRHAERCVVHGDCSSISGRAGLTSGAREGARR